MPDELTAILEELQHIGQQLADIARAMGPAAPNYQRPMADFAAAAWLDAIGADLVEADEYGPAVVGWGGHLWRRRSGAGKYGPAVWYSRAAGRDDAGDVEYLRLVTFKDQDPAEPLPAGVVDALPGQGVKARPRRPGRSHRPSAPAAPDPPPADQDKAAAPADQRARYKYGDGSPVPDDPRTEALYSAYLAKHRQPPRDRAMLKTWAEANPK